MAATASSRSLPPRHESGETSKNNDGRISESGTLLRVCATNADVPITASSSSLSGSSGPDTEPELMNQPEGQHDEYEGEGLEVVMPSHSDDVDAVEFKLPDDGSSAPLDAGMSRAASSHSMNSLASSGGSSSLGRASPGPGGRWGSRKPPMPSSGRMAARRSHSTSEMPPLGSRRSRSTSPAFSNSNSNSTNNRRPIALRRAVSDTAATAQSQQRRKRPGVVAMAKMGYQECVNAIIRPPRAASYKNEALGPPRFRFGGRTFQRRDFDLVNDRGMVLKCSHWTSAAPPPSNADSGVPCVVYLHGNSSARLEVLPQLSYLLSLGVSVLSFDFAGSGKSDGDYVSLGHYERDDLAAVIAHLRSEDAASTTSKTSTIALWGRSMGAATCLMHASRDPSIACMVVDSAFADLTQLATEMVERGKEHGVNVPGFVTTVALRMIRGSVKKQAGFDLRQCAPIRHVDRCFVPALFVHGRDDVFIKSHHSADLHERYAGDKNLVVVDGDHNTARPRFLFDSAGIFLQTCLQIPPDWLLERNHPQGMNRMAPPWMYPGALDGLREQDEHGLAAPFSRSLSGDDGQPTLGPNPSRSGGNATRVDETVTGAGSANGSDAAAQLRMIIDDDDELDALLAELDDDTGMNIERQDEIQSSLMKMLGGGNADASAEGTDNGANGAAEEEREQEQTTAPEAASEESSFSANCLAEDVMALGLACCQSVEDVREEDGGGD